MEKAYEPKQFEKKIYETWKKAGYFKTSTNSKKKPFTIMIPPPNVTGSLHMGHALNNTIIDILIRQKRMKGLEVLYQPGTDHAGIATQNKVEQKLAKEGKTRFDLGREKFDEEIWKWKDQYEKHILGQLETLGCSCDWSKTRFTMDEEYSKAIKKAFLHYYKKGLIYRGTRVVNWCTRCGTSISDIEVDYKQQKAKLYYFKYDKNFPIPIATTRPETKLGDTGVAVNPKDTRYKKYIGKIFDIDFCGIKRKIKVISDPAVDMEFGTGAVGITPAHSLIDEKMAQKNDLDTVSVIDEKGEIVNSGEYTGLNVYKARKLIVECLEQKGLLEKIEEIDNNLSICSRCDTPIEPLPSKQWFLKMKGLAKPAIDAVKSGKIRFTPKRWEKVYLDWLENIEDWCISRQLWWGHRLPVWQSKLKIKNQKSKIWDLKIYGEDIFNPIKDDRKTIELRAGKPKDADKYWGDFKSGDIIEFSLADAKNDQIIKSAGIVKKQVKNVQQFKDFDALFKKYTAEQDYPGKTEEELKHWWLSKPNFKDRIKKYGIWVFELENIKEDIYVGDNPPKSYIQSEDVLDTWFSSALWPFATLGWPNKSEELDYFYPTTVLSTARDIIFLWVARMVFSSLEFTNEIPFKEVYIHPTVFNKEGKRMSKSLGTGVDPIELIENFGADATRFGLMYQNTGVQDIRFSEEAIFAGKKFANKIWNASRFVMMQLGESKFKNQNSKIENSKLNKMIKDYNADLEKFKFGKLTHELYEYFWHEYCDKIIEEKKKIINSESASDKEKNDAKITLLSDLVILLKLLHPIMPFVTEAVWQELKKIVPDLEKSIMVAKWPEV